MRHVGIFIVAVCIFYAMSPLFAQGPSEATFKVKKKASPMTLRKAEIQFLYNATQGDPARIHLVTQDNSLFVDLQRELERSHRDRKKMDHLRFAEQEVKARIEEMMQLKKKLSKTVHKKTEANENLKYIVTLYESISADKVAVLLRRLPFSVSLAIMRLMNPRQTSKVLAAMDDKYAAEVSRRLIQMKKSYARGGAQ